MQTALIVVDVQQGFDHPSWGTRNNPDADRNIKALLDGWHGAGQPVVVVRHDSIQPESPLLSGRPGNRLRDYVAPDRAALFLTKDVNSAFLGTPDLHAWLSERGITDIVVVGIQTNMCVETTARMGGNLGYHVTVPIDATYTFDLAGPDGVALSADELTRATVANLHGGGFAQVVTTEAVLSTLTKAGSQP